MDSSPAVVRQAMDRRLDSSSARLVRQAMDRHRRLAHRASGNLEAEGRTVKRPHKYNARPTTVDGITFASAKESRRYAELKLLERAGEIRNLELQPVFPIVIGGAPVKYPSGRTAKYCADFSYFEGTRHVVEDVKSPATATPLYKLKRALVEHIYHTKIVEV